ncbi:hypothetical protein ACIF8T_38115 [Streptomyces sp. NPDC085946]|uniref:hypothetical protein n=1 Tax=Streptomyces sp. NPDC085946 TaxID=3365744 RepID=UPI0037CED95E
MPNSTTTRMPKSLIFILVLVCVHAIGAFFGGWAIIDEVQSKLDHGQDPPMPMAMAWLLALFCCGLAALHITCVAMARGRRSWVRVALIVCLSIAALGTVLTFLGSLIAGAPSHPAFLFAFADLAALWTVSGETGRRYFSARAGAQIS